MKRTFVDAPNAVRCKQDIKLRDGTGAQCGRRAVLCGLCTQHARLQLKQQQEATELNIRDEKLAPRRP